jgi:REP element-mobilizing transposase RayT
VPINESRKTRKKLYDNGIAFFVSLKQKDVNKIQSHNNRPSLFYNHNNSWLDRCLYKTEPKYVITNALKHCQEKKGLEIYAYCLMSSHLHLLCKGVDGFILSDIMRDFKKFTSKEIVKTIQEEPESRREWMLEYFQKSCEHLKKEQKHKVWQGGYHAEIVESNWFIKQKINYIHNNPVKDKIVTLPEDYYFSSARNYAGLDYQLEIILLDLF